MTTENKHERALLEVYRLLTNFPWQPTEVKLAELKAVCESALVYHKTFRVPVPGVAGDTEQHVPVEATWIGEKLVDIKLVPLVRPGPAKSMPLRVPPLGMTPWHGGYVPWDGGTGVSVKLRNGVDRHGKVRDFQFNWIHPRPEDVVFYRLDIPAPEPTRDELQP